MGRHAWRTTFSEITCGLRASCNAQLRDLPLQRGIQDALMTAKRQARGLCEQVHPPVRRLGEFGERRRFLLAGLGWLGWCQT